MNPILQLALDAYIRPRIAVRAVMNRLSGPEGLAILFGLAYCANVITAMVFGAQFSPEGEAPGAFGIIVSTFFVSLFTLAVFSGIVTGIGRLFGGSGGFLTVALGLSWLQLISSVFNAVMPKSQDDILRPLPDGTFEMAFETSFLIAGLISLYLFVNVVAEVHQFKSAWKVLGVMIGSIFSLVILFTLIGAGGV
ncbi:MAG: YIP1 family protein [Pikeienuella sp.]